jgi:hypothetical protein
MVLQTLTDINCVGGSRAAIPVSNISFHFIHLTSIQLVVQTDRRIFYRMLTLEWEEKRIIACQYLLHTLQETEGKGITIDGSFSAHFLQCFLSKFT